MLPPPGAEPDTAGGLVGAPVVLTCMSLSALSPSTLKPMPLETQTSCLRCAPAEGTSWTWMPDPVGILAFR